MSYEKKPTAPPLKRGSPFTVTYWVRRSFHTAGIGSPPWPILRGVRIVRLHTDHGQGVGTQEGVTRYTFLGADPLAVVRVKPERWRCAQTATTRRSAMEATPWRS